MSFEMSAKDKKLLVYLVAVGIVALAYFFAVRPLLDKNEKLTAEIETLQREVNELTDIYNHQDEYEANIATEHDKVDAALKKFPGGISQENTLMMLQGIEDNTNTWISRVSFTEVQYISGGASGDEFVEAPEGSAESEIAEDVAAAGSGGEESSEDGYADESGEGSDDSGSNIADLSIANLSTLRQDLSLDYSGHYSDFKRFIDYIENYDSRLFISSLNASYSPEANEVSGSITLSQFAVEGAGKKLEKPDLSNVSLGVDNIFTTLRGTTESSEPTETLELGELNIPEGTDLSEGGEPGAPVFDEDGNVVEGESGEGGEEEDE